MVAGDLNARIGDWSFPVDDIVMMCLDAMWAERVINNPKIKSRTNLENY